MKKFTVGLLVGVVLGRGGFWTLQQIQEQPEVQHAAKSVGEQISRAGDTVANAAHDMKVATDAKLEVMELTAGEIQDELEASGQVIRRKARDLAGAVADTGADALITAEIKTKLAADDELSVMTISVDTTNGRVTVSGTVSSVDLIGKAMILALETEGVQEVVSTLQVQ